MDKVNKEIENNKINETKKKKKISFKVIIALLIVVLLIKVVFLILYVFLSSLPYNYSQFINSCSTTKSTLYFSLTACLIKSINSLTSLALA